MTEVVIHGVDKVLKNLRREMRKIKGRTAAGLFAAGLHLKGASQKEVPVMTGNLRNSAFVVSSKGQRDGQSAEFTDPAMTAKHDDVIGQQSSTAKLGFEPEARVGYSAVYALSVHENPRAGKTGGSSPTGVVYSPGRTGGGNQSTRIMSASGGKWKFLEDPLKAEAGNILKIVRHFVKERK